jgi:hypothetical protein
MWKPFIIGTILATIIIFFLNSMMNSAMAETNTVSSTVVTNSTPPTANSPSVVVNNSDVCKTAVAGAVQTQILGISSGMTVTDENCERIKLSRSLYAMGMKVAAISTLCADSRVWDSMHMAGTPCPYMGSIGNDAKEGWLANMEMIPEGSVVYEKIKEEEKEEIKNNQTVRDLNDFEKFVIVGMAMYIGVPILF